MWNSDLGDGNYRNPILYTDYSDPDAIRVGNDYFMIASSFCNAPAIPILHSVDLVNWECINYVMQKVPGERYQKPIHGCGVWAPSIRYHEGLFYVCFPMPDEGIFMCTTKDVYGKWSEPVNILPGAGLIDPCPFWDEDGKAYLVVGVAKSRIGYKSVLYMMELSPDGMSVIGDRVKIFDGNENDQETIEGPKLYKKDGYYYIFAPAGGVKPGWQTVLRSKNIFGPYDYRVVMRQGKAKTNGPHQGAWVDTVTGEDWFLHFQDVYSAGRIIHLQPMTWVDGWPVIGQPVDGECYGEPVDTYRMPDVAGNSIGILTPETSDDFKAGKLNTAWQWNANYEEDWYAFSKEGLILNAVKQEGVYGDLPNLLLQKWPAPSFTIDCQMDLSNLKDLDQVGMISMGMDYGLVTLKRVAEDLQISFVCGHQTFGKILAESTEESVKLVERIPGFFQDEDKEASLSDKDKKICLRMEVLPCGYQDLSEKEKHFPKEEVVLSYSLNGEAFQKAGSFIAKPGRWVGTKAGIFCVHLDCAKTDDQTGSLLVRSFEFQR